MHAAVACAPAEPAYEVRRWQELVRDCANRAPGCFAAVAWSDARRTVLRIEAPEPHCHSATAPPGTSLSVLAHRAPQEFLVSTPPSRTSEPHITDLAPSLLISRAELAIHRGQSDTGKWETLKHALEYRKNELQTLLAQSILLLDFELQSMRLMMVLELLTSPTMLLDEDAHPRFFNSAARELLTQKRQVFLTAHHQISLPDEAKNREFRRLVKAMASGAERFEDCAVLRYQSHDREALDFVKLSSVPSNRLLGLHKPAIASGSVKIEFIVARPATALSNKSLQNAFDMTAAQANLAAALCDGLSLDAYAEREGIAISTVRWHLHNLLNRTETHNQAELIRLLLTIMR